MGFFSDIKERFKKNNYDETTYLENFNEDIWKNLNIKQKKQCINLYEKEVAIKKGRPSVNIIYENMEIENRGSYSGNTIKINSKLLDIKQPYELIYTIAHEQQHTFQNYSIENKVETSEQYMWKLNLILNSKGDLINYYDAGKTDNEYNRYYLQPVEYNANAIALESCKNIFSKYESKEFDKWSSLKENGLKDRIMDLYFDHSNFQKDMLNHFEDRAKNIGYNIENLRTLIVDLKDIEWVKQLENPQVIKKLENLKKCSFEDTEPLDINEVRAKLNESKKPLEKILINEKTAEKYNKVGKQMSNKSKITLSNKEIDTTDDFYGKINFLGGNGAIGETILYDNKEDYNKEINESYNIGRPITGGELTFRQYIIEKNREENIFETSEVSKIDNTKGIVHIYQFNDKPERCFLGKKEDNQIKKLSEFKTIDSVKKEFKELKKYIVENSKTINKEKIKTNELSL